jgi:hypothetical protein
VDGRDREIGGQKQGTQQSRRSSAGGDNYDSLTCKRNITPASLLQIMACVAHFPLPFASSTAPHRRHRAGKAYPPIAVSCECNWV